MSEKIFRLGNFLVKMNVTYKIQGYVASGLYTMTFCTQDGITICEIPMSSTIFLDLVDILRWYGIDGGFMYDFPPAKLFEQYTICIGYELIPGTIDEEDETKIDMLVFKEDSRSMTNKQEIVVNVRASFIEFSQFIQFLIDYSFMSEGR